MNPDLQYCRFWFFLFPFLMIPVLNRLSHSYRILEKLWGVGWGCPPVVSSFLPFCEFCQVVWILSCSFALTSALPLVYLTFPEFFLLPNSSIFFSLIGVLGDLLLCPFLIQLFLFMFGDPYAFFHRAGLVRPSIQTILNIFVCFYVFYDFRLVTD